MSQDSKGTGKNYVVDQVITIGTSGFNREDNQTEDVTNGRVVIVNQYQISYLETRMHCAQSYGGVVKLLQLLYMTLLLYYSIGNIFRNLQKT